MVSSITKESGAMGMVINTEKTETQHIGPVKIEVKIHINENELQQVENFVYLGGKISEDTSTDQNIQRRIGLACGVMQSLNTIWKAGNISKTTKVRLYDTLVIIAFCCITRKHGY